MNRLRRLDERAPTFGAEFARFAQAKREAAADVSQAVSAIIAAVSARGDSALLDLTERFDGVRLTPQELRVLPEEIEGAWRGSASETRAALEFAAGRIRRFHERQLPSDDLFTDDAGVTLGTRWTPIDAVGLYVPGGTASYPSSLLMNAIPAKVAGVRRTAMVVPAPKGAINPLVLSAARLAGIDEIYRVGGAQAIAALAFGSATIAPVDKIVGPGNAYVAEAKRQVFGRVGIDLVAGPSEVLIVADAGNDPAWIACDMIAQAEHDETAQSVLVTDSVPFADSVERALDAELPALPRRAIAEASLKAHGAIILVERLENAHVLINELAPEHVQLAVNSPAEIARHIRHAGAIFLGRHTPEALGDYVAGTNHVLPTGRSARFASGLSVLDFMKRTSIVGTDERGLSALGPAAEALARAEGLWGHARSVRTRLGGAQ